MSVYKDTKNNTWKVYYRFTDWQGKVHQSTKRGFPTKREALAWEREQLHKVEADLDMTFESFIDTYTADMKNRLKENTWHTKEHIIRTKLLPYFAKRKMNSIQPKDIIAWQNEMIKCRDKSGEAYSPVYLKTLHNQLSAIFNHAVKFYGLKDNPAAKVGNMGKAKAREMLFWTQEEYKKFSEEMMDKPVSFYAFEMLYWCGIREGELLAGSPKIGKSFLMAQLAYQDSTGLPLWGYKVRKTGVLYFALEDNYARLQRRLFRMFGAEAAENLYFATHCKTANSGLEDQIRSFMKEHPNTGLIIIDTLKRVREVGGADFSYSSDYDIVARLKTVADSYKVTMVIVHHTRKLEADDKFDMIAGTNGLLGAADGGFVLSKEKRTSNAAVLDVTGRDQEDQRLHLTKNPETLVWELESVETELWQEPPDPFLESIAAFLSSAGERWEGTASELCSLLKLDCKPNVLSLRLNIGSVRLLRDHNIHYKASRNHGGRKISLWKEMESDSVSKGDDRDDLLVGSTVV